MSTDENAAYHGKLLRYLYKKEGTEKFKLWPKKGKNGEVIEKATQSEIYDDKGENILPRDSFFGRGTGGFNIGNKLKVVDAYLLNKMSIDQTSFLKRNHQNLKRFILILKIP